MNLKKVFLLCFASLMFLMGCSNPNPGLILVKNIDQNIDMNVTGVDWNSLNSLLPLKDQNVDNDLTIQTTKDLTVIGPSGAGVEFKSDSNKICFPAITCEMSIDFNGTALVIR